MFDTERPPGIALKSIGELVDDLITTSMKIYHLLDLAMTTGDGAAALKANQLNVRRNELMRAIDERLGESRSVSEKQFGTGYLDASHHGDSG